MNCIECGWCTLNNPIKLDKVCCNQKSQNYNNVFSKEESKAKTCDEAESQQEIDYRELTPWGFASKYYM